MRTVVLLTLAPTAMAFGWYWLSLADVGSSFGGVYLSRELNEGVFFLLGQLFGMSPERLPAMLASGIACDGGILLGILALRRRRALTAWFAAKDWRLVSRASPQYDRAPPAE